MKLLKPVIWIALGIALGVTSTIVAASNREQPASPRVVTFKATGRVEGRTVSFLKDKQSGGCWVVLTVSEGPTDGPMTMAVAPKQACY